MPKQPAFPGFCDAMKKTVPRREQFLGEMETVVRMYFLQNWYALSDPMGEKTLYDSEAMRPFAEIELGGDRIPDETTILNFRHLLDRQGLTEAIFADVKAHRADRGITLRSGTLVDATIINAQSSTKNKAASSTARLHDSQVWDALLHYEETSVWTDKGDVSAERESTFAGPGKAWGVMCKAPKDGKLHPLDERANRIIATVRAKVEHPFRVIKRQFGHMKTRYLGLVKHRAHLFTLYALGNMFLMRRRLMA